MRSPEEIQRARVLAAAAHDFLREQGESRAVSMSYELHVGMLRALEWVLGEPDGEDFAHHLAFLESKLAALTAEAPQ